MSRQKFRNFFHGMDYLAKSVEVTASTEAMKEAATIILKDLISQCESKLCIVQANMLEASGDAGDDSITASDRYIVLCKEKENLDHEIKKLQYCLENL